MGLGKILWSPEEKSSEGSINTDAVLPCVSTENKMSLIKAWEESEKFKAENKAQKMLSLNADWERSKEAEIESELKLIEKNLETKRAKYRKHMKKRIANIHKVAEKNRASIEAKRDKYLLKAEETSAKRRGYWHFSGEDRMLWVLRHDDLSNFPLFFLSQNNLLVGTFASDLCL